MAIAQRRNATTASIPAPLGGWNARDSLANMDVMDAVQMDNFFPTPTDVTLRKGYKKYSTGITGKVNSLMNYSGPTAQVLFAAAGTKIYQADGAPATVKVTGLTSDKFQHINISTPGGNFLVACNGSDPVQIYDGTNWFSVATTETAQTISSITHVGAVATVTTASAHGLVTGNRIVVSGATPTDYNGAYVITVTGTTTFTYTMATTPASNATVVGSYTVLGITGVNSSTFINVNLFKNRLYFTQKDTLKCWYLPVESIGGAASPLDFGSIARNGGYLQAMGTWTLDAGQGADDYAVFVTNMGEVIVYNGTDPSTAATWALKGVWQLGQTFNRRCFFKWSGDLLLLTQDGLVPLASALQSSRLDPRVNLTDKIFYAVSQAASSYYNNFGWQINYFAAENMLILSIPANTGMEQYVMHTITKSWARFTGIEAYCWEVHDKSGMYFGGDGFVGEFYTAFSDNGSNINATVQQAYNYFDSRGQQKRFTMVRPILLTDNGVPGIYVALNTDYQTQNQLGQVQFSASAYSVGVWDSGKWDQSVWGGYLTVNKDWQGVTGIGYCGSISLNMASQGIDVHWASTDFVMEKGGVI
jgi:hypothetical protein